MKLNWDKFFVLRKISIAQCINQHSMTVCTCQLQTPLFSIAIEIGRCEKQLNGFF